MSTWKVPTQLIYNSFALKGSYVWIDNTLVYLLNFEGNRPNFDDQTNAPVSLSSGVTEELSVGIRWRHWMDEPTRFDRDLSTISFLQLFENAKKMSVTYQNPQSTDFRHLSPLLHQLNRP
jgi:hypothetical protein